jgi:hypothetical protein
MDEKWKTETTLTQRRQLRRMPPAEGGTEEEQELHERIERAKLMTPAEWRSLKHIAAGEHIMRQTYLACFPSKKGRYAMRSVAAAVMYCLGSPTWRELGREDAQANAGYDGWLPAAREQCILVGALIRKRGVALVRKEVEAGLRPAEALDIPDAALIVALNHQHLQADVLRMLRDELKRRDKQASTVTSYDSWTDEDGNPAEPPGVEEPSQLEAFLAAEREEMLVAVLERHDIVKRVLEVAREGGNTLENLDDAIERARVSRATFYRHLTKMAETINVLTNPQPE